MATIKVNVVKAEGVKLPEYATIGSSGMDVRANIKEPITLGSLERALIPTGIRAEIPEGYEIQVRPRSGLALKHGIGMANSIGTIDSDYRGDIGVILVNLSKEPFTINPNDRIAQLVLAKVEKMELIEVKEIKETTRGAGGYGHTGVK